MAHASRTPTGYRAAPTNGVTRWLATPTQAPETHTAVIYRPQSNSAAGAAHPINHRRCQLCQAPLAQRPMRARIPLQASWSGAPCSGRTCALSHNHTDVNSSCMSSVMAARPSRHCCCHSRDCCCCYRCYCWCTSASSRSSRCQSRDGASAWSMAMIRKPPS